MLTFLQGIILGLLQGVTELFPISSLGHSVILPSLLGWSIRQDDDFFIVFLVATHLATALVLLGFFWRDWLKIAAGFFRSLQRREVSADDPPAKLAWLLVVGTIPAGIVGLLLEVPLRTLFASAQTAAVFLALNGALLVGAEILRVRRASHTQAEAQHQDQDRGIARMTYQQAIGVGLLQVLALIPGFSRTGSTIAGGLLVGLSHEDAARYSFLLATPIIGAAAVLKLPDLALSDQAQLIGPILAGALVAAVAAYLSVRFLTRYFRTNSLTPFAIYCFTAGIAGFVVLRFW